jgi:hypothetical protein
MAISLSLYEVISTTVIELTPGGDIDRDVTFELPDNTASSRGVLTYVADARSPNNLAYSIAINGTAQLNRTVDSNVLHAEQKVVSGFRPGQNTLTIRVTGGTETLIVDEIVLHYTRLPPDNIGGETTTWLAPHAALPPDPHPSPTIARAIE